MEKQENSAACARRLAAQLWGKVNSQEKVLKGAWFFSCECHGGYIVDLKYHPQFVEYDKLLTYKKAYMKPEEQHFAALEEDCDFALFEYVYQKELFSNERIAKIYHDKIRNGYIVNLERSLDEYHHDWFETYKQVLSHQDNIVASRYKDTDYPYPEIVAAGLETLYRLYAGNSASNDIPRAVKFWLKNEGFIQE